jgi:membrane-bound inhibitor of C-type lysozyme
MAVVGLAILQQGGKAGMVRYAWIAVLAATAVGCAARESDGEVREVSYLCANGDSVSVRFDPERDVAVLNRHGAAIELQQQPSGSGFHYSSGPNTIRGHGNSLRLEIGRMVPIECEARVQ